jgi:hypothetical protein
VTWWDVRDWATLSGLSRRENTIGELARGAEIADRAWWDKIAFLAHHCMAPHLKETPPINRLHPYLRAEYEYLDQKMEAEVAEAKRTGNITED